MMSTKSAQGQLRAAKKRLKRACRSGQGQLAAFMEVHDAVAVLTALQFMGCVPRTLKEQEPA